MDTRETRDYAREAKFVIDARLRPAIVEWSRANLEPDGHGAGVYADEYTTASLYFETDRFDVYCRKESYGRSKYRIRRYGLSDIIFLERKFRTDRLLAKRRTTVPVSDLERLASERAGHFLGGLLVSPPCAAAASPSVDSDVLRPRGAGRDVGHGTGQDDDRPQSPRAPDARPRVHSRRRAAAHRGSSASSRSSTGVRFPRCSSAWLRSSGYRDSGCRSIVSV